MSSSVRRSSRTGRSPSRRQSGAATSNAANTSTNTSVARGRVLRFDVGTQVLAEWEGSNKFYPATIVDNHGRYTVKFEGSNTTQRLLASQVVLSKTPQGRSRTPPRQRQPSRTPTRSRSRSRSRSPARGSVSRSTKRKASKSIAKELEAVVAVTPVSTKVPTESKITKESSSRSTKPESTVVTPPSPPVTNAAETPECCGWLATLCLCMTFFVMPGIPFLVNWIPRSDGDNFNWQLRWPSQWPTCQQLWDWQAFYMVLVWVSFQAGLALLPIGRVVEGLPLRDGTRLKYRTNGFFAFLVSMAGFIWMCCYQKFSVELIANKLLQLGTAAAAFTLALCVLVFIKARLEGVTSPSGSWFFDFFMGSELNPRIGDLDLKFFFIGRPGLIGWVIIDFCLLSVHLKENNMALSTPMLLIGIFQFCYVADALWWEENLLAGVDTVNLGFGYITAFAYNVWVPFSYTLQCQYLIKNSPTNLSWYCYGGIVVLNAIGYVMYRSANNTKAQLRRDPNCVEVKDLEMLETSSGKKLIISGLWGMCHHPNYLGDLMMALSWCLLCGCSYSLPYFYFASLLLLLVDREREDWNRCYRKYGDDWLQYCQIVPWRLLPGFY